MEERGEEKRSRMGWSEPAVGRLVWVCWVIKAVWTVGFSPLTQDTSGARLGATLSMLVDSFLGGTFACGLEDTYFFGLRARICVVVQSYTPFFLGFLQSLSIITILLDKRPSTAFSLVMSLSCLYKYHRGHCILSWLCQ